LKHEALEVILDLREDATPADAVELRGFPGYYRIPFGRHQYRIVYQLLPRKHLIRILRVRHRRNVYEGF
jgi:mRNA-degrading endonuclease RelE of RelBE toxin-antitoxin system